jgi:hypothetical protein
LPWVCFFCGGFWWGVWWAWASPPPPPTAMPTPAAREDLPALARVTHLDSGGMSPWPRPVLDELLRIPRQVGECGPTPLLAHDEAFTRAEAAHR